MPDFVRAERLSEDLATGRHNWREHKLALVLLAAMPADGIFSLEGSRPLQHTLARDGRNTTLAVADHVVRAEGAAVPPFAVAAVVNATTGAPIGTIDLGRSVTLEDGASFTFRFPPALVVIGS
jgi:hypothetical protein